MSGTDNKHNDGYIRTVDELPVWFRPVKWLLPISVALLSGLLLGLAITGVLPIPAMLGKAAWLPAIYASLDTLPSMAMLLGLTTAVSSVIGLSLSFILRATILFQVTEHIAYQGEKAEEIIDGLNRRIEQLDTQLFHTKLKRSLKAAKLHGAVESDDSAELESDSSSQDSLSEVEQQTRARMRRDASQRLRDAVDGGEISLSPDSAARSASPKAQKAQPKRTGRPAKGTSTRH